MATPVGQDPAADMQWSLVLAGLRRINDASLLRDYLLAQWLAQAQGAPLDPPLRLDAVLALPPGQVKAQLVRAQELWPAAWARHFSARTLARSVEAPADLEYLRDRLDEAAPGIWLPRPAAGALPDTAYAVLEAVNRGPLAFPLTAATLRTSAGTWNCALPRGSVTSLLAPGASTSLFCTGKSGASVRGGATALAHELPRATASSAWEPRPSSLLSATDRDPIAAIIAQTSQPAADAWVARLQGERITAARAQHKTEQAAVHAKGREATRNQRIKTALILLVTAVGYVALARRFGPLTASVTLVLVGWMAFGAMSVGLIQASMHPWDGDGWSNLGYAISGIAGITLFALPLVAAVVAHVLYRFVAQLWTDGEYRTQVIWVIAGLLALIAFSLFAQLLER